MHRRIPTPLAISILVVIAAALASYAYFGDTSIKQARRMKLGREFLPGITNALRAHPEFRYVRVGIGTAKAGCFLVVGAVETHAQLSKLQGVIAATKPPLDVVYRLKVLEHHSTEPQAELSSPPNPAPRHR
jgi:hypothetical protein